MRILFIYRHPDMGFSIGKVFRPIEEEMRKYAEVDSVYMPVASYKPKGLYQNIRAARKAVKAKHYDVVHITGAEHYLIPFLLGENVVVTVHDIMYYSYLSGIKKLIWRWLFIDTLKRANKLTFISEYSKEQLLKVIAIPKHKMTVIPNPISADMQYVFKNFNDNKPIILHIGTLERKNLKRSIQALCNIKCQLRIVGKLNQDTISILDEYKVEYTNVYNLSDDDLRREYEKCDMVSFPSVFEGFGMPVIEGQAVGRVVLTSDISPMKDICGEGALLVDPFNIESIRAGYVKLISNDILRDGLVRKGLENAKNYHIKSIIIRYMNTYKMVIN